MVKNECLRCKLAKSRVALLLKLAIYRNVVTDDELVDKRGRLKPMFKDQRISQFITKDYYPDVYGEKMLSFGGWVQPVIIEVDHNHRSDRQTKKDKVRDKHFLTKDIPTVRFNLEHLIGRKKWSDFDIVDLIGKEIKELKNKGED